MAKLKWIAFLSDFTDLIFPRSCAACGHGLVGNETVICTGCRVALPRVTADGIYSDTVRYKFVHAPEVAGTHSFLLFTKKGKVQRLLHALKYRGNQEVGIALGQMFGQELMASNVLPGANMILSVPLHAKKKAARGYNQSDLLAEGLSNTTGIPWSGTALSRIRYTETQTGKSKTERRDNVSGVFQVKENLEGKHIILIDDVLTTGATLEECARTLKAAGCEKCYILTIALARH